MGEFVFGPFLKRDFGLRAVWRGRMCIPQYGIRVIRTRQRLGKPKAERMLSVSAYGVERVNVDPPGQDTHHTDLSENGETQQETGAERTLFDSVHGLRLMEVDPVRQVSLSCKAQTG